MLRRVKDQPPPRSARAQERLARQQTRPYPGAQITYSPRREPRSTFQPRRSA